LVVAGVKFGCFPLPGRNKSCWKVLLISPDGDGGRGGDEIDDSIRSDCFFAPETYSGDRRRMGGRSLFRDRRVLLIGIGTDGGGRDEMDVSVFSDGFVPPEAFFVLVAFFGDDRKRWGSRILFRGRRVFFRIWTDLRFCLDLASEWRATQWR
jgi:hypothetical protein